jgi:hypothetical protein
MIFITYYIFETQINYMWFPKQFKMNEIFCVIILILYVIIVLLKIVNHDIIPCIYSTRLDQQLYYAMIMITRKHPMDNVI